MIHEYFLMPRVQLYLLLSMLFMSSCSVIKNQSKYELSSDVRYRTSNSKYQKAMVTVESDSIYIKLSDSTKQKANIDSRFLKNSFDVDVLTALSKFRPAKINLPNQLTTDFNGNFFIGYRYDRFRLKASSKNRRQEYLSHRAMTFGLFGGIGTSAINPSTTNYLITNEYNGVVVQRGVVVMAGVQKLTIGLSAGWDYLIDENESKWIYQNKPWYGLMVGINLN